MGKNYTKEIEHWKQLDRYRLDWIFKDVVDSFERSLENPFNETMHNRICALESIVLRLTEQLDNEHVSEEFCVPLIEEAKKLISF